MAAADDTQRLPIAKAIRQVPGVLLALPLSSEIQLESYRVLDRDEIRGQSVVDQLRYNLVELPPSPRPYKAFVSGRTGCGKSTELAELQRQLRLERDRKYMVVQFDVVDELDPLNFQPFDVLLLIVHSVIDALKELHSDLPDPLLARRIASWFDQTQVVTTTQASVGVSIEAGAAPPGGDAWEKLIGFFLKAKGDAKFSAAREKKTVAHALNRLDDLVDAVNEFLRATQALMEKRGLGKLLIVAEGFDKREVPRDLVRWVFLNYGNVLRSLDCPLIFTIPLDLLRSSDSGRLPDFDKAVILDIPVCNPSREPHPSGRGWLTEVLERRMDLSLFEEGQAERAVAASGGIIRLLFRIVSQAAVTAGIKGREKIAAEDMTRSINNVRADFEARLGDDKDFGEAGTAQAKLDRLARFYESPEKESTPDDTFASLVKIDAILEYNGSHWHGIHPLTVDCLNKLRPVKEDRRGGTI